MVCVANGHAQSAASLVCFHTKANQIGISDATIKKNTQADIHKPTFARTDCRTDFVNADKETWSIILREEHRLRVFKGTEDDTMP